MKMKTTVEEFLRKERVLTKFKRNVLEQDTFDLDYLLGKSEAHYIGGAFSWAETPEGRDFWNDIDERAYKNE